MDSLFEALYTYAAENLYSTLPSEDPGERIQNENMVRRAIEELTAKGYGEQAAQIQSGLSTISWLSQRRYFLAGLEIGLELNRM